MNEKIEIAKNYHELTKHSYYSVRTTRYYLDWEISHILLKFT